MADNKAWQGLDVRGAAVTCQSLRDIRIMPITTALFLCLAGCSEAAQTAAEDPGAAFLAQLEGLSARYRPAATPEDAIARLELGIRTGNLGARVSIITRKRLDEMARSYSRQVKASEELLKAMAERFGGDVERSSRPPPDLRQFFRSNPAFRLKIVSKRETSSDTMELTVEVTTGAGETITGTYEAVREEGGWKFTAPDTASGNEGDDRMILAYTQIAEEVKSGKYRTAAEAWEAWVNLLAGRSSFGSKDEAGQRNAGGIWSLLISVSGVVVAGLVWMVIKRRNNLSSRRSVPRPD